MQLYLDTANTKAIESLLKLGCITGVTTNPSIIAKEGKSFETCINEILSLEVQQLMLEVTTLSAEEMVVEGRKLAALDKRVIVKIPMCSEGLKAVKQLSSEGIRTNVTLVFSPTQALMASLAGAEFVSVFLGRVDDIGGSGLEVIAGIKEMLTAIQSQTKIVAASVRHLTHVIGCAKAGIDVITVPHALIKQMEHHPLSVSGLETFMKDWNSVPR